MTITQPARVLAYADLTGVVLAPKPHASKNIRSSPRCGDLSSAPREYLEYKQHRARDQAQ